MGVLRNSINIEGITLEENLPKKINGQLIEFSETEYFYLSDNQYAIRNISKIEVKIKAEPGRVINAATGKIIVLDGVKKINIVYRPLEYYQNYNQVVFETPFNTFIDMPTDAGELKSVETFIVDAYFKVINNRKLYCHMLYMVNVAYDSKNAIGKYNKISDNYNEKP